MILTEIELFKMLQIGETVDIEFKEAENKIPNSLWESYSAMANTNGGIIILGIKENKKSGIYKIQGVTKIDNRVQDFWNIINGNKTNRNLLKDEDIQKLSIDGRDVLIINVPRADYRERPIFLNGEPYRGTYKRNAEGDFRCTEEEVNAMIRDSSTDGNDGIIFENYDINDLDKDTIKKYRNRFGTRKPDHPWNALNDEEFIEMIGGIRTDRGKKIRGLTLAGMLMFGKGKHIRNLLDKINFDYREEININENQRWLW